MLAEQKISQKTSQKDQRDKVPDKTAGIKQAAAYRYTSI